ncbi:AAA family ATPase [Sphingobacterium spiritivorum]|uniref:AAA family ATPase n=1 Tax=Sphingobacterium spiritivorum TaxID=258 RepID=UPI003DA342AB
MKIKIKEFGAIKEGEIDLSKKLNIFCGPNGTGKTYVAYAVYGVLKTNLHIGRNLDFIKKLIEEKKTKYVFEFDVLDRYRDEILNSFQEDLDSLFGVSEDFVKSNFDKTQFQFSTSFEELNKKLIEAEFRLTSSFGKIDIEIEKKNNDDFITIEILDKTIANKDIERLDVFFYSSVISMLAKYPVSSTFILPVERNSIFTFSKELSIRRQEAVDHFHAMTSKDKFDRFEIFFKDTKRYPLPIRDGLLIAEDLAEIKKEKSEFYEFAVELEEKLLNGKLEIDNLGELRFKPNKSPKRSLPIHMTASIVKSMSSLVVYLKYIAKSNDLVIIDEPEINLHPDNQIILTRLFSKLINKGFRLLISTHSDYVVRELNNLVMLSDEKLKDLSKKFGYQSDEYLSPDDIDIHYFDYPKKLRGNKQVNMEIIKMESNGFEIPSIDITIDKQNEISEELFYRLKYSDDEE